MRNFQYSTHVQHLNWTDKLLGLHLMLEDIDLLCLSNYWCNPISQSCDHQIHKWVHQNWLRSFNLQFISTQDTTGFLSMWTLNAKWRIFPDNSIHVSTKKATYKHVLIQAHIHTCAVLTLLALCARGTLEGTLDWIHVCWPRGGSKFRWCYVRKVASDFNSVRVPLLRTVAVSWSISLAGRIYWHAWQWNQTITVVRT